MKDPYLIPGQPCEIINTTYTENNQRMLYYFWGYSIEDDPIFVKHHAQISKKLDRVCYVSTDNYRPIGTEWDPGTLPPWAFCSTVNAAGIIELWSCGPTLLVNNSDTGAWTSISNSGVMEAGLCPDLSRWQGDAWITSLRMRPKWAEVRE